MQNEETKETHEEETHKKVSGEAEVGGTTMGTRKHSGDGTLR